MLTLLQAVLGFDNLLYISLESKRAPISQQAKVRHLGIGIAIVLRIILLFVLINIIQYFQDPLLEINMKGIISSRLNLHSIIVLIGGVFILYTATREILHMMNLEDLEHNSHDPHSVKKIIIWIKKKLKEARIYFEQNTVFFLTFTSFKKIGFKDFITNKYS